MEMGLVSSTTSPPPPPRPGFPACGLTVVPLWSEPGLQRALQAGWWWANWGHMCKMKLAASTSWGLPLHPLPPWQCLVFVTMTNRRAGLPNPEQLSNAAVLRPALTACSHVPVPAHAAHTLWGGTCPPRRAPWGRRTGHSLCCRGAASFPV